MKRNAFTLIELIAVVAILAIIFAFTMPKLSGILSNNEDKNREIITEKVISAAKRYAVEYDKTFFANFINVGDIEYITLQSLLDAGLIDDSDVTILDNVANIKVELLANDILNYTMNYISITYSISYNLNDGIVSPANPTTYKVDTAAITLNNPTKIGYTFTGWSGTGITGTSTSVTIPMGSTGNKNYTANFIPNTYLVKYDCNNGSGLTENSSHTYDDSKSLSLNGCYKDMTIGSEGMIYYFKGWSTLSTATSGYEDGASVINLTSVNNGEVTLYAIWGNLFSYTNGIYDLSGTTNDWKLKFMSGGTFTINKSTSVDIFVVGGGGGGAGQYSDSANYLRGGAGGGGGYARTWSNETINSSYIVTIGIGGAGGASGSGVTATSGGSSSFGTEYEASGGAGGTTPNYSGVSANGGAGGSGGGAGGHNSQYSNGKGGVGGTNGGKGGDATAGSTTTAVGGSGQFNQYGSTYEFGGSSGTLYSGGGGGGSSDLGSNGTYCASAGTGGGGTGGCSSNVNGSAGETNTGGGGGGAFGTYNKKYAGSDGGSGIVIIRNHR